MRKKDLVKRLYTIFVVFLVSFFVINVITSFIRYRVSYGEFLKVKSQYEEVKEKYEKKQILYEKLKKLKEGSEDR
ncbi:hypothetical protein SU69_07885 [Thermosipho melanesiensis]|uniref:Uncharacterized protein n=2 Tax=Thermosipho melanesiensis TaxID=46541 RepID=A6LN97_THEM4|nr:hypothetical protein [Thermosipho melanesiensis]ABR31398.1 hypothetical protein Tmel_1553 [Thermosipho melanesiensis BI429]APT74457.1 hypothetical protein BW47_08240 [Thermosipho melanesiensis]OOC36417.1 hypothetical protein SU68_07955 [Thermosipho melanesiensis]OOC37235.1 hypothetical protein SU69_07885 [Thermosipho melanesiensis]OOC37987.1 hypothetical protein SU70_07895 [Thermosipho melanesiensis]